MQIYIQVCTGMCPDHHKAYSIFHQEIHQKIIDALLIKTFMVKIASDLSQPLPLTDQCTYLVMISLIPELYPI